MIDRWGEVIKVSVYLFGQEMSDFLTIKKNYLWVCFSFLYFLCVFFLL